jgi:hypothetical protein
VKHTVVVVDVAVVLDDVFVVVFDKVNGVLRDTFNHNATSYLKIGLQKRKSFVGFFNCLNLPFANFIILFTLSPTFSLCFHF